MLFIEVSEETDANWFNKFLNIGYFILTYYFVLIYLTIMLFSSLLYFLNMINSIRKNNILSFLSFSGIPLLFSMYIYIVLIGGDPISIKLLKTPFVIIPSLYLLITILEFLTLRKQIAQHSE